MRLPVEYALPLAALIALGACSGGGGGTASPAPPLAKTGPAADYPLVIGAPFTVEGTTYTPADKLNSDELGYALVGSDGGAGVTAAHKTLPLPSYVEVTALTTGKTILVRLERRGPMSNASLIELSPGAAAQLGIDGAKTPVRVRRVNPPEVERAMLRAGGPAPARMDTPKGLLAVLMRKLDPAAGVPLAEPTQAPSAPASPVPVASPSPTPSASPKPVAKAPPKAEKPRPVAPKPAAKPPVTAAAGGGFSVQVASFSTQDRAKSAAGKLGGSVSPAGRFWSTRLGPFATRAQADAALAKARGAGYSDARIQRAD